MQPKEQLPPDGVIDIWKELGVPRPRYDEDQSKAPPVDREALRALVRRELPEEEARKLYELVVRFRSWAEAMDELGTKMFQENHPRGSPFSDGNN